MTRTLRRRRHARLPPRAGAQGGSARRPRDPGRVEAVTAGEGQRHRAWTRPAASSVRARSACSARGRRPARRLGRPRAERQAPRGPASWSRSSRRARSDARSSTLRSSSARPPPPAGSLPRRCRSPASSPTSPRGSPTHRGLRPLRRLRADADRRRVPRRERGRDGLRAAPSRRARSPASPSRSSATSSRAGFPAYLAVATAGTVGYLIGAIGGWALGDYLGRPWLERHGRWLHLSAEKLDRAERWFDRWEEWAVFLGRVTPVDAVVHLDAGGRLPGADSARTSGSRCSARRSGASRSPASAGLRARAGRSSTTRSATSTTSSLRRWSSRSPPSCWHFLRRRRVTADEPA